MNVLNVSQYCMTWSSIVEVETLLIALHVKRVWTRLYVLKMEYTYSMPEDRKSSLNLSYYAKFVNRGLLFASVDIWNGISAESKSRFGIRWFESNPTYSRICDWFESFFNDFMKDSSWDSIKLKKWFVRFAQKNLLRHPFDSICSSKMLEKL